MGGRSKCGRIKKGEIVSTWFNFWLFVFGFLKEKSLRQSRPFFRVI